MDNKDWIPAFAGMTPLIFTSIVFAVILCGWTLFYANNSIAMGTPAAQSNATYAPSSPTSGGGSGGGSSSGSSASSSSSASSGPAAANLNSSALSISKTSGGEDLTMLSIDSLPSALNNDSMLSNFVSYMFYFLFSIGIVLSFFEGYRSELIGKTFSYYSLFIRTALIAIGFISWKQTGMSNFAQIILTLADKIQLFLIEQNVLSIGQSVSQIVSSISGSLHSVSIPTISTNGTASVKSGWNLNPVSWFAGAVHAITGTVLMGIIWFLFNIFYGVIQFLMALAQLILLGLLFSLCPIVLGFEAIPYTSGIFGKWMKMFIEISAWGIFVAFEQLVFFTILGKIVSADMPSSGTGMGNILGVFTFAEAVTVFIVMIFINLTVPYFIGKLFDGISGDANKKIEGIKALVFSGGKSN